MLRLRFGPWGGFILPLAIPAAVLITMRVFPSIDLAFKNSMFHLIVGTAIALCALAVAAVAAVAGARAREHGPVWLAAGCICVGILMLIHGLLTPGVMGRGFNHWIARAPYLALTLFAVGVALAGRARNTRTSRLAAAFPGPVLAVPVLVFGLVLVAVYTSPTALAGDRLIGSGVGLRSCRTSGAGGCTRRADR